MPDSPILAFYHHTSTDHRGRTLTDIRGFSLDELEQHHDYIQWLFPLPEGSGVLPDAPRLTSADIFAFKTEGVLREELLRSFKLMLRFYGLVWHPNPAVIPGPTFSARLQVWLTPGNHNHLRLTRIMRSLSLLGFASEARALHACLEEIATRSAELVSGATRDFWRNAIRNPAQG